MEVVGGPIGARREMDRLAGCILRSLHDEPDNFDVREWMWRRREHLRKQVLAHPQGFSTVVMLLAWLVT